MEFIWWIVGLSAAILTSASFIPQVLRGYRTKKMDDVSGGMLLALMAGLFLWLLYGIHINDGIIIGSNVFGLFTLALTFLLKMRYSKKLYHS